MADDHRGSRVAAARGVALLQSGAGAAVARRSGSQMLRKELFAGVDAMLKELLHEIVEAGGHWIPISAAPRVAAAIRALTDGG